MGELGAGLEQAHIGRYFLNSAIVVARRAGADDALRRDGGVRAGPVRFRGRRVMYFAFVGGMMFPVFLALVPLFFVVQNLGLLGTCPA